MINIELIEQEIIELEKRDTSFATVERLAWLYVVKDHLNAPEGAKMTSELIGSEFLDACSNVPINSLLSLLGEHFEIIKAMYPKEYQTIIANIRALKKES